MSSATTASSLDTARHIKYWQRCHGTYLPSAYTANDSTRLTFGYFIVSALDLLSCPLSPKDRSGVRSWALSLQHPDGGFCGSATHALPGLDAPRGSANLAATFFALLLLAVAADSDAEARAAFAGVQRRKLLRWLSRLQREDGSFGQVLWDGEPQGGRDVRHSYLASGIRWMLRGAVEPADEAWVDDVDVDALVAHVRQGQVGAPARVESCRTLSGSCWLRRRTMAVSPRPRSSNRMVRSLDHGLDDWLTLSSPFSSGICLLRDSSAALAGPSTAFVYIASQRGCHHAGRLASPGIDQLSRAQAV